MHVTAAAVCVCLPLPNFFRFQCGTRDIKGKQATRSSQNFLLRLLISVIVKTDLRALPQ
jgi:hypothetical protein